MSKYNWTAETTEVLIGVVGTDVDVVVSRAIIETAAEIIEGTGTRNITGKLRNMGYTCESMAKVSTVTFTPEESTALADFANANAGSLTFAEIAAVFADGKFDPRQIQGKLLSMELSSIVKPTEKVEVQKQYTDEQEVVFISMVIRGECIEDIATEMGKEVKSARGKALSLLRKGDIDFIPITRDKVVKPEIDLFGDLDMEAMTVEEVSNVTDKSIRGVKTTLTRRGLDCVDYKGSVRKAKIEAKKVKAEEVEEAA